MAKIIDPVCDMIVDVEEAREQGLTLERPEREYAFCAAGCLTKFAKSPQSYIPKVEAWLAQGGEHSASSEHGHGHGTGHGPGTPAIDAGMREWYKSCRCCLSDAHPEVVKTLDAEKEQLAGH